MGRLFSCYGRNGLQGSFFPREAGFDAIAELGLIGAIEGSRRISRKDANRGFELELLGRAAGG